MTRTAASPFQVFATGIRDVAPVATGIVPFGMITGAAAAAVGLTPPVTVGMSLIVFAGASQLAAVELLARQATWPVILLTILVVNLRFVMYSAVLAPHFARLPLRAKAVLAALITDQAFAVTVAREQRAPGASHLTHYFLGAALLPWVAWQTGTVAGVLLGPLIPAAWQLEFSMPLVFLALLVPLVRDRAALVAAIAAGLAAVAGRGLPWNLGLILAAVVGVGGGLFAERAPARTPASDDRRRAA